MNKLDKIYLKNIAIADYAARYSAYISEILKGLAFSEIDNVIRVLQAAREEGKTIFFTGNGGSAATCSHFVEDLAAATMADGKKPFRAISLADNTPYLTALANDEGYDHVFEWQLKSLLTAGDVVVAISGSGNSLNLIKAVEYAKHKDAQTIGILGFDGGKLRDMCQHTILVKAQKGEYAPVEDVHLILTHIICTYLMYIVKEE